ncbi:glycosyltransferase family 87 protein [Candidatus Methylomirabilis sp.]|uniref:glycosyltransferase family 87 protein n=1 Tax=Candidatus Methylomirabilis sp. TaxID=2032687 RepID=UPI003C75713B
MIWILTGTGLASAILYGLNFRIIPLLSRVGLVDSKTDPLAAYPFLCVALFCLYLLALVSILRKRSKTSSLGLILGFAILFRAILLFFMPQVLSTDIYRYVWDGRVQSAGINPYAFPPAADALRFLRDEQIFPLINRQWAPTIYPPGAQVLFAGVYQLFPDSIVGMKFILLCFDLATIALIVRLLKRTEIDPDRVLLYAWSPLALFELAGSGHLDALMLPFVLLALAARTKGRAILAGGALGVATLIKLYPAVLFSALYQRRDFRFPLAFGLVVLLGYAPYVAGAGIKVIGFLPGYIQPLEDFNVGLRYFLSLAMAPFVTSVRTLSMFLLATCLLLFALRLILKEDQLDLYRKGYLMAGAYLLLLPTSFHPWYLVWLLPFLCLFPSWGWLYLSAAISLSYLTYTNEYFDFPLTLRFAEFLPLYFLLLLQALWHRRTARRRQMATRDTQLGTSHPEQLPGVMPEV